MQAGAPKAMLGRMMSLLMLSSTGLAPVSQALAGFLAKWNLTLLFVSEAVLVMTIWTAFRPELGHLSDGLTRQLAGEGGAE